MSFTYTTLKEAIQDYTENDETGFIRNLPLFIELAEERILKNVQLTLFQKNASGVMTSGNQYVAVPSDFMAPFSLSFISSGAKEYFLFKDLDFVQTYTPNPATTGTPIYYAQFDVNNFVVSPTPDADYDLELNYLYRPASLTTSLFTLTLTSVTGTFTAADTITGGTSGQSSDVSGVTSSTTLLVGIPSGSYTVGETITGSSSGATGTLSAIGADTSVSWMSEEAKLTLLYGCLTEAYTYMKGDPALLGLYQQRFSEGLSRLKNLGEGQEIADEYRYGPIRKRRT